MIDTLYINSSYLLVRLNDYWWSLIGKNEYSSKMVLNYTTITLNNDNSTIFAVDPPSGPFMCIGARIRYDDDTGFIIKEIKTIPNVGIILKLKEEKK